MISKAHLVSTLADFDVAPEVTDRLFVFLQRTNETARVRDVVDAFDDFLRGRDGVAVASGCFELFARGSRKIDKQHLGAMRRDITLPPPITVRMVTAVNRFVSSRPRAGSDARRFVDHAEFSQGLLSPAAGDVGCELVPVFLPVIATALLRTLESSMR
jgi:hypothetical protein